MRGRCRHDLIGFGRQEGVDVRGYDFIGDVHGCASMLVDRLVGMGYTRRGGSGAYTHPDYHAVFVGDLIDRGPQQRETLELVKAVVESPRV
jgi:Calcineurin-like phosphoesterase